MRCSITYLHMLRRNMREKWTDSISFWAKDFHHINNVTVHLASEPRLKCSNLQTGSRLTALVKLESSALNQVVLTVWLLCHSCWQEISVNSTPLAGHAPSLPIDSGLQSYGHKVTKTGFAHQYLTWHNTQPNVISMSTAQNNTHKKEKRHRFKYFNIIQSMSLFALSQVSPQTARQWLHKAESRSAAPLTRSTLLPAYFPPWLWMIVTEPCCWCSWVNCSRFFICFMFPVWGKKKIFL